MNCACSHSAFNHNPVMAREGSVRFSLAGCAVKGCGCEKYEADERGSAILDGGKQARVKRLDTIERQLNYLIGQVRDLKST
jgi:hypothetical protein